jgi:filamentous hemagglutinin family protein
MKTVHTHNSRHGCPLWHVQTVVVRLSRKITVTYRLRAQRRLSQLMSVMLTCISPLALALPTGAELVAGQATINTTANSMVVNQATDKAILNWQTFNIGAGQSVQFVQPSASSVALNRVTGNQASSIYGSLSANGQVFLINSAGVMFAPGAQVNVGGLVASSLGISNENFLAGKYTFTGNAGGAVENYGAISSNGGYVVLAAPTINNAGSIDANGGSIGLLAGSRVTVDNSGAGLVKFSVDAAAAQAAIVNSGAITADGGQIAVLASAMGDAMATVINQTGVIRANSAVEHNGVIVLSGGNSGVVKVAGTVKAAGTNDGSSGGSVQILGDKVALLDGAHVDVSGKAGGGTVLVGGDYQGKGTAQNANKTLVSAGTVIDASATNSGNGGKVVVWADDATRFYGDIKVKGGALAGDGGFVEVSGKQALDLHGRIDVAAPVGVGGKVLLDPQDIVINTSVQPSPPNNANGTPDVAFTDAPNPGTYTIQIADVTGYSELFLQASRDITLSSALAMSAGNSVRLEAGNNITTNAALNVSGVGSIDLKAGNNITTNAAVGATGAGSINLKADADNNGTGALAIAAGLSSQAGGITLSGASVSSTAAGLITTTGAANGNAGQVSITSTGLVNLAAAVTANGGTAGANQIGRNGGAVNISGTGGVTTAAISANGSAGGTGNTAGGNAGAIALTNSGTGNLATGAMTASTGNAVGTGAGGTAGSIALTNNAATGNISTGNISTAGGAGGNGGNVSLASQAGVTVTGTLNTSGTVLAAGTRAGSNAGNITITGINRSVTGAITASGSAANGTSQAGGNAGLVSITGTGTLNTAAITSRNGAATAGGVGGNAGNITLSGTNVTSSGALTTSGNTNGAGGLVNIAAQGAIALNSIAAAAGTGSTVRGDVTLLAGGPITQTGGIVAGNLNATTANAAGSAITLNNAGNDAQNINLQVRDGTVSAVGSNNAAAAIAYRDSNAVVVSGINNGVGVGGALSLTTAGAITQTGAIVAGSTSLTAGATNSITLQNAGNDFSGPVSVGSTLNVSLADANALALGTSAVSGTLNLNSNGAITQTGALTVTGVTTLVAGTSNDITLNNAGNNFSTVAVTSGRDVSLRDNNALIVGTSTASNSLTLVAAGAITQTGAITTPNLNAKTLVDAGAAITLTNAANNVNNVDLRARNLADTANAAGAIAYTDVDALNVAGIQTTGNVTLIAGNSLTQTGGIAGSLLTATTRNNAGAAISLVNSANNVATVNLQVRNLAGTANAAAAIEYTDSNAVAVSGINNGTGVGGNVTLNAGGSITQSGAINTAMLAANLTSAASSLTLSTAGNNIAQLSNITTPGGFTLANGNNAVTIAGAINTSNTGVSITSGSSATTFAAGGSIATAGGNVVLTNSNVSKVIGTIDTTGGASTGNFTVSGAGAISQQAGSALKIKGATAIAAGAGNNVTLTETANDFGGAVTITNGLNVALKDSNALALGTSGISGTLNVVTAGALTQTGALTVTGATTLAAGTTNDITLNNASNNFSSVAVSSANNTSLRDSNALTLGTSTISGTLGVVTAGALTQTGALTVTGATTLAAGTTNDITLNNAGNNFSSVGVSSARNVSIQDSNALALGTSVISGTLNVSTAGALTQTGALTVTGATTLAAGTANDITLNNTSNNFSSVAVNSASNASLRDSNALVLAASNASNTLTVVAGGAITQSGAITANTIAAKTLVNAGAAITLNNAANEVVTVDLRSRNLADTVNAVGAISYRDASAFNIANASTTGALTLQSNGNISQTGVVTAASLAVSGAGAGAVNLASSSNAIGTLNAITAAGGFALNNGNTSVAVAGNITTTNNAVSIDTGTGTYTQNANIDIAAGSGPITLTADTITINANTGNNALTTSGALTLKAKTANRAMSLAGASAFDLTAAELTALSTGATGAIVIGDAASTGVMTIGSAINLAGKTLTLNAGSITDVGVKTITASKVTLNANGQIGSNANGIDIAANNLSVNTSGNANAFVRTGAINLGVGSGGSNVGNGTLDIVATGNVTQTASTGTITAGTLNVKTLSAGIANIALNSSANNATAINLQARNAADNGNATGAIQYSGNGGFDVAAIATNGNAALSAGGSVTQSGGIVASGLALGGSGGDYSLRHANNAVTTLAANTSAIDYSQANALIVGTVGATSGVTTTGAAKIETTGVGSNLTLNNGITSAASGDAIVLKAGSSNAAGTATGGQFINAVGAAGLNAANGRYLVYSGDPAASTEGVSGYSKRYNTAASFTLGGTSNMFMYRVAPTLTVTADNTSRVYGQANPGFTGTATGFIDGDTAASVGVSRSSTATFNTAVAAGPATITSAVTNNENYTLVLSNGQMNIDKASINNVTGITAADKIFDGNTSATLNTGSAGFNGMLAGDALTVATASGTFDTPAIGTGKSVQINGITLGGASAANYTLADSTAATTASIIAPPQSPSDLLRPPELSLNAPQVIAAAKLRVSEMNAMLERVPSAIGESDNECEEGNAKIWQAGGSYRLGGCGK